MEFRDGQTIEGTYDNRWTRRDGEWYDDATGHRCFGDDTADWLINLNVATPTLSEPKGPQKLSKSGPPTVPVYVYKYTLKG
jgi:hypothetical protein